MASSTHGLLVVALSVGLMHCGGGDDEPPAACEGCTDATGGDSASETGAGDALAEVFPDSTSDAAGDSAFDADAGRSALDPTFGTGGVVTSAIRDGSDVLVGLARQTDGRFVAVGSNFAHEDLFVARFNADGTRDAGFGVGGRTLVPAGVEGRALDVALQPDGKIVALVRSADGARVVRLDTTGALDGTFGAGGVATVSGKPFALAVQSDGKILVALGPGPTLGPAVVARLNLADGALDATFGAAGRASAWGSTGSPEPFAMAVDGAGRIVVVAELSAGLSIARFTSTGAADATFGGGAGTVTTRLARDTTLGHPLVLQTDRRIVTGGRRLDSASERVVARFDESGALDTTFDSDGYANTGNEGALEALALDSVGGAPTIVALRGASLSGDAVYRFSASGARDATFGAAGRASFTAGSHALVSFDGGKLILGGEARVLGGGGYPVFQPRLLRAGADGALDPSFGTSGRVTVHTTASLDGVRALTVMSDGAVLAAGGSSFEGATGWGWAIAKYSSSGALDPSFGAAGLALVDDTSTQAWARAIAVDSTNRIVVAGGRDFATARFTASGARDTTFGTNGSITLLGASGYAYAFAMALDGSGRPIVVGTQSTSAGRSSVLVRSTVAGASDATFGASGVVASAPSTGVSSHLAVALQSDGKILATGTGPLTRYSANGVLDSTFSDAASAVVGRAIHVAPDGKILVAGSTNVIGNVFDLDRYPTSGSKLVVRRHLATGALDASFAAGGTLLTDLASSAVTSPAAFAVRASADGRVYVAGSCIRAGVPRGFLARLLADGSLDPAFGEGGVQLLLTTGAASGLFALALHPDGRVVAGGHAYLNPSGDDFALLRVTP